MKTAFGGAEGRRGSAAGPPRRAALKPDADFQILEEAAEDGQHPVDDEDVAELYRVSDVVLMTSASEGFGLPLLEAALARVPIVCTDLPVFQEIGRRGIHTFPVDAQGNTMAAVLEAALNSEAIRHRRNILRGYDWCRLRMALEGLVLTVAGPLDRESRKVPPIVAGR